MKPSTLAKAATIAGMVFGGLGLMQAAQARTDVVFTVGVQVPAYYAPQPYVVAPVYVVPRPVYLTPEPVYRVPSPVYYRPGYDEGRREHWRHEHRRHEHGRRWHREHRHGWEGRGRDD